MPSTHDTLLTLTLRIHDYTAQVVEMSVTVSNIPIQNYAHLEDHIPPISNY